MNISNYEKGNIFNHDEKRTRKLLLHKKEIIKINENIKLPDENYLSFIDANNNLIYYKYSNLPSNLKGIRIWIERYENNKKSEHNTVETYAGGNNISISIIEEIKNQFTMLSDNKVEINLNFGIF